MKGIVLAGGEGTRLYPTTKVISKQILPIYDKPMIYYPLGILMMAGISDILIISTPRDINTFKALFSDGKQLGIRISYAIQEKARGIADAFILGEKFIEDDSVALILGDNIFYGDNLQKLLTNAINNNKGATIFAYHVDNPKDFGVVEFDKNLNVISIQEKPKEPKSSYAVPGLYFYNNDVVNIAKKIKPSARGEIEITAINESYLKNKNIKVQILDSGVIWLDTGTHENLLKASIFVKEKQENEIYIGCIEEIAYKNGYIDENQLLKLSRSNCLKYQEHLYKCVMGEM